MIHVYVELQIFVGGCDKKVICDFISGLVMIWARSLAEGVVLFGVLWLRIYIHSLPFVVKAPPQEVTVRWYILSFQTISSSMIFCALYLYWAWPQFYEPWPIRWLLKHCRTGVFVSFYENFKTGNRVYFEDFLSLTHLKEC